MRFCGKSCYSLSSREPSSCFLRPVSGSEVYSESDAKDSSSLSIELLSSESDRTRELSFGLDLLLFVDL